MKATVIVLLLFLAACADERRDGGYVGPAGPAGPAGPPGPPGEEGPQGCGLEGEISQGLSAAFALDGGECVIAATVLCDDGEDVDLAGCEATVDGDPVAPASSPVVQSDVVVGWACSYRTAAPVSGPCVQAGLVVATVRCRTACGGQGGGRP